jgi:PAS domain S-box-containing protein
MSSGKILHIRPRPHPRWIRYGVAFISVVGILCVHLALAPYIGVRTPSVSLFVAVVFSSWFGGIGPGLFSTVLAAALNWYYVVAPANMNVEQWAGIVLFLGQGALVSYLIEALRRSRRRINRIIASISDGFAVFDSNWRIVYVNKTGAGMAGVAAEDLVGRSVWELFPGSVGTLFWQKLQEAAREGKPIHFEYHSEEFQRWFEHTAYPSPEGVTLFTHDITRRKKDRADLEAAKAEIEGMNEKLERRVQERTAELNATIKELEAFSYTISHDLRAPLRAIDGFSKLLLEDYYSKLDAEGRRLIDVIRNSTVRMGHLIDGLLAFSHLGRQTLASSEVDMAGLAEESYAETSGNEPGRKVNVRIAKLPPALGDRVLLRQVFVNLFSNALKFTRGREPALIEAGFTARGDQNVFFVRDNGVGFDMRYADKLFGVFQRLHGVNEFEGTGLGLAIVHRIINRHGGKVWAEGALNQGATIFFSLPRLKPPTVQEKENSIEIPKFSR